MLAVFDPTPTNPGLVLATEADYLPTLLSLLDSARARIDLLAFSFAAGSADGRLDFRGDAFAVMERLKRNQTARGRTLRTRIFLEGHRDTAARNRVTGEHLAKAGIDVRFGATHAKGVVVDGRYVLFGSSNLTNQSLTKNYETNVLIDDAAAARQFTRYFDHSWAGGAHGGVKLRPPFYADGAFKRPLIKAIDAAEKQIAFSIYFFAQVDVEAALIRAHARGVRILGLIHNHRTFGLDDVRRTRATVTRLRAAGLDDLHAARPTRFTHSKYLIVDRRELWLGTGNWLDRDVTTHPQLYARFEHPALAARLAKHLRAQVAELRAKP